MCIKDKILSIKDHDNKTAFEIAELVGTSVNKCRSLMIAYNISYKKSFIRSNTIEITNKIRDILKNESLTCRELSLKMNVSMPTIENALSRMYDVAEDDDNNLLLVNY